MEDSVLFSTPLLNYIIEHQQNEKILYHDLNRLYIINTNPSTTAVTKIKEWFVDYDQLTREELKSITKEITKIYLEIKPDAFIIDAHNRNQIIYDLLTDRRNSYTFFTTKKLGYFTYALN